MNQLRDASDVTRLLRQRGVKRNYEILSSTGKNEHPIGGISHTAFLDMAHTIQSYGPSNALLPTGGYIITPCVCLAGEVLYVTYPQDSQPFPPYVSVYPGDFTVTVAGGSGGAGFEYSIPGQSGGLVTYTFRNIPVGTPIYYIVGGQGENSYNAGGGGAGSAVSIGDITVIAGGGNGHYVEQQDPGYPQGAGGTVWGDSPIPNILTSLNGVQGDLDPSGGAGGGDNPGSGSGPVGSVITSADTVGSGYVRIVYSPPLSMAPFSTLPVSLSRTRY